MSANYYKLGSFNVMPDNCDFCQRKRKREDFQITWDNYVACKDTCYSPRHPSTLPLPPVVDALPVANARPRQVGTNIYVAGTNTWTSQTTITGTTGDLAWNAANCYWNDDSTQFDNQDYDPNIFWPLGQ